MGLAEYENQPDDNWMRGDILAYQVFSKNSLTKKLQDEFKITASTFCQEEA